MNVRLVTATSRSTDVFRRDFLERIGVLVIELPPLRDRRGDIVPLAHMFLSKVMQATGQTGIRLSDDAEQFFKRKECPVKTLPTPEAVADAIVTGLQKGHEIIWAPGILRVVFSVMRHLPRPVWRRVSAR